MPTGCQLTVQVDGEGKVVCCSGCEAVANLIVASGLSRYYRFRTESSLKPAVQLLESEGAWQRFDERKSLWGYAVSAGVYELLLQVEGVRCAACTWLIRSQLEAHDGIDQVQVDVTTGFVRVRWRPAQLKLSKIASLLARIGYQPHLPLSAAAAFSRQRERRQALQRLGVAGLGMMQVMMYAVALYAGEASGISAGPQRFLQWVSLIVSTPVVLYSGAGFFTGAWQSLRHRQIGMDVPVAVAIGIAFTSSCYNFLAAQGHVYFDSVVMFIFFLSLGRYAELVIRHRNLQTGLALARLLPEWAEQLNDGVSQQIPAADLRVGDRVRVRMGQPFPADGLVLSGSTAVNEALLTGESKPVDKQPGDKVIAGSINLCQTVEATVSADPDDSTVSVLGRMLVRSQTQPGRFTRRSENYAGRFVAIVLAVAAGTALWWLRHDVDMLLPATLAVLVISCPCALSLATPAAVASASRALLERGVLLTRGRALELLAGIDTVVFDKTGTLTKGSLSVANIQINPARSEFTVATVLQIAASLEAGSAHPMATAFARHAVKHAVARAVVYHCNGIEGRVNEHAFRLGNPAFVEAGIEGQTATENAAKAATVSWLWLADDTSWVARFELEDNLREAGFETIAGLQKMGLKTIILSGDQPAAVEAVAMQTGVNDWFAEQSPQSKMSFLENMQADGHTVLMIGDGINDAPVLSVADVSMTVSGASELANSTADFILTGDSLALVQKTFATGVATAHIIRQNLVWALVYNLIAVPFAAAGLVLPWMAALGMSVSSLLVVLNSGRLARRGKAGLHKNVQASVRDELFSS